MKRVIILMLLFSYTLTLFSACGNKSNVQSEATQQTTSSITKVGSKENDNAIPKHQYVGEYEQDYVYQKLVQIENCLDPDVLCQMLFEIYNEEFTYIKLEYQDSGYKDPYSNYLCSVILLYNSDLYKSKPYISSDTYLFFKDGDEEPCFVMDCDGTYIVSKYEVVQFSDGTYCYDISSWFAVDLFMCLHEYINEDDEQKAYYRDGVSHMDWYLSFENLIVDSFNSNAGSIGESEG